MDLPGGFTGHFARRQLPPLAYPARSNSSARSIFRKISVRSLTSPNCYQRSGGLRAMAATWRQAAPAPDKAVESMHPRFHPH